MFNNERRSGFFKSFFTPLLIAVGIGVSLFYFASNYFNRGSQQTHPPTELGSNPGIPQPQQLSIGQTGIPNGTTPVTTVAKSAMSGVVGVSVLKAEGNSIFDRNATEKWGLGTGVIVSPNGYILTNNHVAGGKNKRIVVSMSDGSTIDGTTVCADPTIDLAVVKINSSNLTPLPLGNSDNITVGETAIAIGNPLGLQFQRTVTSGIISALNRTIQVESESGGSNYMEDLIQTDASINPGNSGGPLLNSRGEVIGINTIKVTTAEGMGFAIPINIAVPIINHLLQSGKFTETYMGVFAYDREVMPYVNNNVKLDKGIYVANVDPNGPAAKKGIKVGCIITQVDGIDMHTMLQLRTYIYSKNPGDTLNVTHIAKDTGKTATVPITLIAKEKDGLVTR